MKSSEAQIIADCIEGKRLAQSQLYKRYAPTMFGVCLRYAATRVEAEDLLQEGFMKVFTHIKSYRGQGSFEGWMRRIFANTAINHYHSVAKHQIINVENIETFAGDMEDEPADWLQDGPDNVPVSPDTVMKLIQVLPEGYRMVLNLYVFEGCTHKEIGEMLQISENTSKSQLSKARRYLKNQLSQTVVSNSKLVGHHEK